MQSQRLVANERCECFTDGLCNCVKHNETNAIFLENIYDIATALSEVMMICGIHQCKVKASVDVIIHAFLHYDEIRHRIDAVPHKRLCKEDLIHDLGRKCLMNRLESQLSYSIIKRAFKAFYHGTTQGGLRNPIMEAQLVHSQECLWVHAAKRTAQIFASYEGMFYSAQRSYESQIRCVYKRLYQQMQKRADPVVVRECDCQDCATRVVPDVAHSPKKETVEKSIGCEEEPCAKFNFPDDSKGTGILPKPCNICLEPLPKTDPVKSEQVSDVKSLQIPKSPSNVSLNLARCYKCNCPKLICDCEVDRETGVVTAECSQGPYKCTWVRMDDADQRPDPCIYLPANHQCPVDCDATSISCDEECECDCGDECECVCEDSDASDYEDNDVEFETKPEEEDNEMDETDDTGPAPVDMTEISERDPNAMYGGCRVAQNHIVEEMSFIDGPANVAQVVELRKHPLISSESAQFRNSAVQKAPTDKGAIKKSPQKAPSNVNKPRRSSGTAQDGNDAKPKFQRPPMKASVKNNNEPDAMKKKEHEEINKILGELL